MNQAIWIGITIGVFFAGIGISYAMFSSSEPIPMRFQNQEQFNHMMSQNPEMSTRWMDSMNTPQMQQWMSDPEHAELMVQNMRENHDFMMEMFHEMVEDPQVRMQMMGHMTDDPETWEQMQQMMNSGMPQEHMDSMHP